MVNPVRSSADLSVAAAAESLHSAPVQRLMRTMVDAMADPERVNLQQLSQQLMSIDLSLFDQLRGQPLAHTPPAEWAHSSPERRGSRVLAQGGADGTIGTSGTSLAASGCAIGSLGMLANQAGTRRYHSIEQVNDELTRNGGLEGSKLHWADAGRSVGLRYDRFVGFSDVDEALQTGDGHYVAAVDYKEGGRAAHGADHFVAVREYDRARDVLVVADPAGNGREIAMTRGPDGAFYAQSSRQGQPVTYRLIYMHRYETDSRLALRAPPMRA